MFFCQKIGEIKWRFLTQNAASIQKRMDFEENRQLLGRKLAKIAVNSDRSIGPS
jgi:hypothetical protein